MGRRPVLLYDSDCRFCRFVARTVVRLDRDERVAFLPLTDPEARAMVPDLTEEQRKKLLQIADKCPVHRTLSSKIVITTQAV